MTTPEMKRFNKHFAPIADAIASVDIDQVEREMIAKAVADGIAKAAKVVGGSATTQDTKVWGKGWRRDLFVLLASDPLVPCAGWDDPETDEHHECPTSTVIRIGMHNSSDPEGRSQSWKPRAPYGRIRCVTCGSMHFNDTYRRNVLAAGRES